MISHPLNADLHIHSVYSDSDATLEDIFTKAQAKQLCCIALTDHDTMHGVAAAQALGQQYNIEVIPALELSAQFCDHEVHVLGYCLDPQNVELTQALQQVRDLRWQRLESMVEKLRELGIKVQIGQIKEFVNDAVPTRLHLGLHLVKIGAVSSLVEAFKQYLSPGKPAYVARFKYTVAQAIDLIHAADGRAVLAHPHMLKDQQWIQRFVEFGIDGIEVVYPRFSQQRSQHYQTLADDLGLLKTGGSDAHGSYKHYTDVGAVSIPYEWVEKIKESESPR